MRVAGVPKFEKVIVNVAAPLPLVAPVLAAGMGTSCLTCLTRPVASTHTSTGSVLVPRSFA